MNRDMTAYNYFVALLFIGLIVTSSLTIYHANTTDGRITARNFAIADVVLASVLFVLIIWYNNNVICMKK